MSEKITVVVEKPITVTHIVNRQVGTAVVQRVGVNTTQRQRVVQQAQRNVAVPIREARTTEIGLPGLQGPAGERGPPGTGAATFVFEQVTPLATWHIDHELGQYPSVTVVDSGGTLCMGAIEYIDENTLELLFSAPFAGKAFLN